MSVTIKLNKDKRQELLVHAANEVYLRGLDTWFGREMMEYRDYVGYNIAAWLINSFDEEELRVATALLDKISSYKVLIFKQMGPEYPPTDEIHIGTLIKSKTVYSDGKRYEVIKGAFSYEKLCSYFRFQYSDKGRAIRDSLARKLIMLPLGRELPFVLHEYEGPYAYLPDTLAREVCIYSMMVETMLKYVEHELCAYELVISRKTSLKALASVWPGAMAMKEKFMTDDQKKREEAMLAQTPCGIMTEEEAVKRIAA
jgi:hypothetical protein